MYIATDFALWVMKMSISGKHQNHQIFLPETYKKSNDVTS